MLAFMQAVCQMLTNHRWRKLIAHSIGIYPVEYHWRCKICKKGFWNYKQEVE